MPTGEVEPTFCSKYTIYEIRGNTLKNSHKVGVKIELEPNQTKQNQIY